MLPDTDILSSELRDIFRKLDLSQLSAEETFQLANGCEEHIAGLCHGLHFLGKPSSHLQTATCWSFPAKACVS